MSSLLSLTSREKYGLSGLVIRISRPSIERTSAGSLGIGRETAWGDGEASREHTADRRRMPVGPRATSVGPNRQPGGMRRSSLLAFATALVATACTRPALYYPDPDPGADAPRTSKPVATPRPTKPVVVDVPNATVGVGASSASDVDYLFSRHLLVPVAGADMSKVDDSFNEARDGGRTHRAIDILAPRGTPILSA